MWSSHRPRLEDIEISDVVRVRVATTVRKTAVAVVPRRRRTNNGWYSSKDASPRFCTNMSVVAPWQPSSTNA